jgi:replicative DNA helicase
MAERIDPVLLHNVELEQRAIGALLMHEGVKAVFDRYGGARLFFQPSSRHAWRAIEEVAADLGPSAVVDGAAVVAWMDSRGLFGDSGGGQWFKRCRLLAPQPLACEAVARALADLAERRELGRMAQAVNAMAIDGAPKADVLAAIHDSLRQLDTVSTARTAGEVATAIRKRHDALMSGEAGDAPQQSTGIGWLDWILGGGVTAGHCYFVLGLYKQGKTKFAVYLMRALLDLGFRVDSYSVEMSETEIMARLLSCKANVSESRINGGKVGDTADYDRFVTAASAARHWKWRHQIKGKWRAEEIAASAAHYALDNPKDRCVVFVDYIQDVGVLDARGMRSNEIIGEASRQMKSLATDLDVPVFVLSQLTPSKVEGRNGANEKFTPVPVPSDMRGSADGLMHAHHLLILHRPWWQLHDKQSRFTVLDLALTRTGGNRRIYLYSDLTFNRYAPWSDDVPRPFPVLWKEPPYRQDVANV